jgi:pilus assembly protein CpaB
MERRVWVVSIAAAMMGFASLRVYMHRLEFETSGGPPERLLVLTRDVHAGATLTREMIAQRDLPRAYVDSRHVRVRDLEQVMGGKLAVSARAGETLLWTDLDSARDRGRSLASLVPEGLRAVSITPGSGGAAELIAPGDRVDVLLAPLSRERDTLGSAVRVAENLLVLAVGNDLGQAAGSASGEARRGRSVSVAATPEQSLRLAAALHDGVLQFVLRNPDDLSIASTASNGETHPRVQTGKP